MQPGVIWQSHQSPALVWPASATGAKGAELVSLPFSKDANISGTASTQKAAKRSRFFIDLSSGKKLAEPEGLAGRENSFRHFVGRTLAWVANCQSLDELGHWLVQLAQHAYCLRDSAMLQELSQVLLNLPTPAFRHIGQYYQALALRQTGKIEEAFSLVQEVADKAPPVYRGRAIQTMGAIHHRQGRVDEALRFYTEALRVTSRGIDGGLLTALLVHLQMARAKSQTGDHRGALVDYERLFPLVRIVSRQNPLYYYFYHNEVAVEFGEMGRIAEAGEACKIALASPFAHAYPEWSQTRQELEGKRTAATRSIVAIGRTPEAEPSPQIETKRQPEPSRRLSFTWPASNKASFQRSVTPFPAKATSSFKAVSILDRVLDCIGPRAPPSPH
jgi:tetratricopeptide (TPR) repeat protein